MGLFQKRMEKSLAKLVKLSGADEIGAGGRYVKVEC
jgi:hypothetical protein